MKIKSVFDKEFAKYGKVLEGNFKKVLSLLEKTPLPNKGVIYCPGDNSLEEKEIKDYFENNYYGNMPIQIGYCNGFNEQLNCLEYHKGNEINIANNSFILLLGSYFDIHDNKYDTSKVEAFFVPAKVAVEIYSTTLHYAPCGIAGAPFKVLIVLPKGTNVNKETNKKDPTLWATNKWLLAHKDSKESRDGAFVGLVGDNIIIE